jgi:hypothetical protein
LLATLFLALLAPVGLVAGVLSRPDDPIMSGLPSAVLTEIAGPSGRIGEVALVVNEQTITLRTWKEGTSRFLQVAPERDVQLPDVLVYWMSGPAQDPHLAPPNDAVLVGNLAGARARNFRLPSAKTAGSVVLYSLAHKRGLGSVNLPEEG